ncbi:MAG: NUDIX hydrolase [Patescibacteria group bacterium]|nr:NUDIX hydrolase [Patescibacteria group bacterium]
MAIKPWRKLGSRVIFSDNFGKKWLQVEFMDPRGKKHVFNMFDKPLFVVILPLTATGEVVTIVQYYQGSNKVLRTLPGGNIDPLESSLETVRRELLEETGYVCPEIIQLGLNSWPDPRNIPSFYHCFLGIGAQKNQAQKLDEREDIEVELIPLPEWLRLSETETEDSGAAVTTHRALPHLRERGFL